MAGSGHPGKRQWEADRRKRSVSDGTVPAVVQQRGVTAGDEPGYASEPEHLVLARVLLRKPAA